MSNKVDFVAAHLGGGYASDLESEKGSDSDQGLKTSSRSRRKVPKQVPSVTGNRPSEALANRSDGLNAWQRHLMFMQQYKSRQPARPPLPIRTDAHVLAEHHKFLRNPEEDNTDDWEVQLAVKYYNKLFKEYALADLSRYKEGKIGFRWRTEQEVVAGKGQFICGNIRCEEREGLESIEVDFVYKEDGETKNALVKLRVCPRCKRKARYKKDMERRDDEERNRSRRKRHRRDHSRSHSKDRKHHESSTAGKKRRERSHSRQRRAKDRVEGVSGLGDDKDDNITDDATADARAIWKAPAVVDTTNEEDVNDYFSGLFP